MEGEERVGIPWASSATGRREVKWGQDFRMSLLPSLIRYVD
jgi:hypothetical protein